MDHKYLGKDSLNAIIDNFKKIFANKNHIHEQYEIDKYYGKRKPIGKARIWYHSVVDFGSSEEDAAKNLASYDIVVPGGICHQDEYGEDVTDGTEKQVRIIKRAKELNPDLKIFYYFSIASWRNDGGWSHILGAGGTWDENEAANHPGAVRINTKWELYQMAEYACHVGGTKTGEQEFIESYTWTDDSGVEHTEDKYIDLYKDGVSLDGIFYDDAGMETDQGRINQGFPKTLRDKYIQLVDYTHSKGLSAFPNQLSESWYGNTITTANPEGKPSAVNENDFLLLESCHSQVGFDGKPLWRHVNNTANIYSYIHNVYSTGKYPKIVINDYLYGTGGTETLTTEEKYRLATYCVLDSIASGAHYIDLNGLSSWDDPELFNEILIDKETEYFVENTKSEKGHYKIIVNGHTIEIFRSDKLAQGETVSEKSLNKIFIYLDDVRIKNLFNNLPSYTLETNNRLDALENGLEEVKTSAKSTANIYHRMMIDDWSNDIVYTNYASGTVKAFEQACAGHATVESIDYNTESIRLKRTDNVQLAYLITIPTKDKLGHTFEFGYTVNEITNKYNFGYNKWAAFSGGWEYGGENNVSGGVSKYYGQNFIGRIITLQIPEDTEEETAQLRIVVNGAAGEIFDLSNFYLIDTGEFKNDITKEWYTNIAPAFSSGYAYNKVCYDFKPYDTEGGFDITYNDEKKFTTWAGLRWDLPSGTFKPGHTYEIGVEKYEDNSGDTNIAFRIFACGGQYWFPKNNKITSVIYGDSRIGRIVTVPETATATTAYITFCNVNSSCKNSNGDYLTSSVRGFYIYDVNEEDIIIRGEEPSNSYLQFCRVTEKKLAKDKKLIGNALYVTDEGNSFVTDFYGKSRKPLISEKIEFNNTGDKLQWKYKSEESWNDLLDIKSLKDEIKKEMMAGMVIVSDNSEDVEKEEL